MTGVSNTNGSGISDVTPPTLGSPNVPKYVAPPSYTVQGPALAGFENTNRVKVEEPKGKVENILQERGKRYGTFLEHARIAQALKADINTALEARDKTLSPDAKQALDVICDKIARIINGDPDYADNWDDIAGYATLVSKRLTADLNKKLDF